MARWLGFIYPSGAPRPIRGPGSVEDVVSHLEPVQRKLRMSAAKLATIASMRLDVEPEHRTGASQIHMQKRDLDWIVYLDEGEVARRKPASAAIESELHILSGAVKQMGG